MNASDFLLKISNLSWRNIGIVLGSSFVLANGFSLVVAQFFLKESSLRPAGVSSTVTHDLSVNQGGGDYKTISKKELELILERNIFNSEGRFPEDDGLKKDTKGPKGELSPTDLPLRLVGTIYGGSSDASIVMIENTSKKSVSSFMVGDVVMGNTSIKEIQRDRVILDQDGASTFLAVKKEQVVRKRGQKDTQKPKDSGELAPLAKSPPPLEFKEEGFERRGDKVKMTSGFKSKLLGVDFAKVLQDAKAEPYLVDGEIKGWTLNKIREDAIYRKLGLQDGDVVLDINGTSLGDPAQSIRLLQSLMNEAKFEVTVKRGGGGSIETVGIDVQ